MDLSDINKANKITEDNVFSIALFSANAWMTLAAPLVIGLFASKLFASQDFTAMESALYAVAIIFHLVFTVVVFVAGNRKSTSIAVDEISGENANYRTNIIPNAKAIYENSKTQQYVTYLMTLELESLIDEINTRPSDYKFNDRLRDMEAGLNRMLWHIVEQRTPLFGCRNDSLYNFALYLYESQSDELVIKWRSHDNRMSVSNRRWRPGFGHVGLAFIQGEAKICQDITASSELSDGATDDSDKKKYRSFISVPIKDSLNVYDGKKPFGVLVFTSDQVGQFSWERDKIFVLTVAKLLSMHIERNISSCMEGYDEK